MFSIHNTLALLVTCNLFVALHASDDASGAALKPVPKRICPSRCNLAFRCDPYYSGPPIWTVLDGTCKLFKTDCLFASANCQRQNECLPKMSSTSQQECQLHCIESCAKRPIAPVCAIFPYVTVHGDRNDGRITFANQCELDQWACWNAKAYIYASEGACF